jgi:hypothetical protein
MKTKIKKAHLCDYCCSFCGFCGGWHGCRNQALDLIARYFHFYNIQGVDPQELTSLIGELGYWQND